MEVHSQYEQPDLPQALPGSGSRVHLAWIDLIVQRFLAKQRLVTLGTPEPKS